MLRAEATVLIAILLTLEEQKCLVFVKRLPFRYNEIWDAWHHGQFSQCLIYLERELRGDFSHGKIVKQLFWTRLFSSCYFFVTILALIITVGPVVERGGWYASWELFYSFVKAFPCNKSKVQLYCLLENLTDFRKVAETGVDTPLVFIRKLCRNLRSYSDFLKDFFVMVASWIRLQSQLNISFQLVEMVSVKGAKIWKKICTILF